MSQTLILDTGVSQVINPTSSRIHGQERQAGKRTQPLSGTGMLVSSSSLFAAILSTLLLRVASRISFVLLGFYLGEHFTSATIVAVVLEAFYLSELMLAPMVGSLSDRLGHKPFLLFAPLVGSVAAFCFVGVTLLFPHPHTASFDAQLVALLLAVLVGRLQRTAQKAPFFHKTGMNGRSFRAGWDGDAPGSHLVAEESVQGWRGFAVPAVKRKKERKARHSHVLE